MTIEGFNVEINHDTGVYVATVKELPGCVADGKTREEAIDNIKSAMASHVRYIAKGFAERRERDKIVPIDKIKAKRG